MADAAKNITLFRQGLGFATIPPVVFFERESGIRRQETLKQAADESDVSNAPLKTKAKG